jgi:hypothetical protein
MNFVNSSVNSPTNVWQHVKVLHPRPADTDTTPTRMAHLRDLDLKPHLPLPLVHLLAHLKNLKHLFIPKYPQRTKCQLSDMEIKSSEKRES